MNSYLMSFSFIILQVQNYFPASVFPSLSFFLHLSQHKQVTLTEESSFGILNFAVFIIPQCMAADVSLLDSFLHNNYIGKPLCPSECSLLALFGRKSCDPKNLSKRFAYKPSEEVGECRGLFYTCTILEKSLKNKILTQHRKINSFNSCSFWRHAIVLYFVLRGHLIFTTKQVTS